MPGNVLLPGGSIKSHVWKHRENGVFPTLDVTLLGFLSSGPSRKIFPKVFCTSPGFLTVGKS